ncbi:MAG: Hsp20/alpha crystallin family protein [Casimicrobiaceae bacterium]
MTAFIRTNGYGVAPRALLSDPFISQFFNDGRTASPEIRLDVEETHEAYLVRADLPGIAKDLIGVEINDDIVKISVEFKSVATTDAKALRTERVTGEASRSIRLPSNVDASKAEAKHVDGVLQLTLPKQAPTAKRLTVN